MEKLPRPAKPLTLPPDRPVKKIPEILTIFFLGLYSLFFCYRVLAALLYPFPIEYGEGAILYEVQHLLQGDPAYLYKGNETAPYRAAIYTPLYYYLSSLVAVFSGTSSFISGRLVTVAASFFSGFLIFLAARGRYRGLKPGPSSRLLFVFLPLAAALTPFATAPAYAWGVLFKPDMLALAFSLGAVYLVYRTFPSTLPRVVKRRPDPARQNFSFPETFNFLNNIKFYPNSRESMALLAGFLCALAFLTKQSALAGSAAIFFFLCWRERRSAIFFVAGLVGVVGSFSLFFQLISGGQFFNHVINYNRQDFQLSGLLSGLEFLIGTHPILLLFAFLRLYQQVKSFLKLTTKFPTGLWEIYFVTALLLSFSIGKEGANLNYYLEPLFIASLLSWEFIAVLVIKKPRIHIFRSRFALPGTSLVFLLMAFQFGLLHHVPLLADGARTPGPRDWEAGNLISAKIREYSKAGPILFEESGWAAINKISTNLDDSFVFGQLAQDGQWSQKNFLQELEKGFYKTLIYEINLPPEASEEEIDRTVKKGELSPVPGRFSSLMLLQFKRHFSFKERFGRELFLVYKKD